MKKTIKTVIIIAMLVFFLGVMYILKDRSLDAFPNAEKRHEWPVGSSSNVNIGIVGDSWVSGEKLDKTLKDSLSSLGGMIEVVSSGHDGAKSRQIYRNLLSISRTSHGILMSKNLDYLVVVAGVNDTVGHIGREFYAHHMLAIIMLIQSKGVHPVIVEIPEYGVEDVPSNGFFSFAKRLIYHAVFDHMRHNVIKDYRQTLRDIIPIFVKKKMTLVSLDASILSYQDKKNLYSDTYHLNEKGLEQLGLLIAKSIEKTHNARRQEANIRK